jgi:hypothetical protein
MTVPTGLDGYRDAAARQRASGVLSQARPTVAPSAFAGQSTSSSAQRRPTYYSAGPSGLSASAPMQTRSLWDSFLDFGEQALETAGEVASGALDRIPGGAAFFEAYDAVERGKSQFLTYGLSALPGGPRTASWEEAGQISPGQMFTQSYGFNPVFNALRSAGYAIAMTDIGPDWLVEARHNAAQFMSPDFDIYDPEAREQQFTFRGNWAGAMATGGVDAVIQWYTDPGVVVGKGAKVLRTGARFGEKSWTGVTNRTIRTDYDKAKLVSELDSHDLWLRSNGTAGKKTAFGTAVERTVSKNRSEMFFDPLARQSNNRNLVASLLGESTDYSTSALIVRAGIGDFSAMTRLEEVASSTADALRRATALSEDAAATMRKPVSELSVADWWVRSPESVDRLNKIVDDLTARDALLQNALGMSENIGSIYRAGSTSATFESMRGGILAKATQRRFDPTGKATGYTPKWGEEIFQRNPWVRPVRLYRWVAGERPSGMVPLKGAPTYEAGQEIFASLDSVPALNRSADAVMLKQQMLEDFLSETTAEGRMRAVQNIEARVLNEIAGQYDIDPRVASEIYNNFAYARSTASEYLKKQGYLVDTDGSIIRSPQLISQLADAIPMMDFRLMEGLIKRQQSSLRRAVGKSGDVLGQVMTPFYTAWKASVLFRLGYTIRNVLEGNLRSAAAVGFIPTFAEPLQTSKRVLYNNSQRAGKAKDYVTGVLTQRNPKYLNNRINLLRSAKEKLEQEIDSNIADTRLVRTYEPTEARGWAATTLDEYLNKTPEHGRQFDLGDFESALFLPENDVTRYRRLLAPRERQEFMRLHEVQQGGEVLTGSSAKRYRQLRSKATRSYLRDLQASGLDVVVKDKNGKFKLVENPSEIDDLTISPAPGARKGVPPEVVQYIEDGVVRTDDLNFNARLTPNLVPDIYLVDRWREMISASVEMGETVPSRAAAQAGVRNPRPVTVRVTDATEEQMRLAQDLHQRVIDIDDQIAELQGTLRTVLNKRTKRGKKRRLGDDEAFAGTYGDIARRNSSADLTYENVIMDQLSAQEQRLTRIASAWVRVDPGDPQYWSELTHVANFQFKNDNIATMALAGKSRESAEKWLRSKEGVQYRKELGITAQDVNDHVDSVFNLVERYIPDPQLRLKLSSDQVLETEIRSTLQDLDQAALSPIHGRETAALGIGGNVAKAWQDSIGAIYKVIGTIPENYAVRHPFYNHMWKTESERLVDMAKAQGVELTDKVKYRIDKSAHRYALKETRQTLYTIERFSNPAVVLKWLMPFFPAIENTIKVWTKIGWNDWSVVARANLIWNAPNATGMVIDSEGNTVPPGAPFGSDQFIRMPQNFRDALAKYMPGGMVPDIPKGSLNVVLQGEAPIIPGVGPTVSVPASMIVAAKPELEETLMEFLGEDVYKTIIPFGRPSKDPLDMLLPPTLNRLRTLSNEDSTEFKNSVLQIWRDDMTRWMENGGLIEDKPTEADALEKARDYWKMRTFWNALAPVAARFTSPYDFYLNKYREYTNAYGFLEGERKYDEEFGSNYRLFKESLTRGTTGFSPDQQAYKMLKSNSSLWNEIVSEDPELGQLITNPVSRGEFSPAVYEYIQGRPISPGSNVMFRSSQSVPEFEKAANIDYGWSEYSKARTITDELLAQRGLNNINDPGAEDIKDAFDQWLDKQESENQDWYNIWVDRRDPSKIRKTITAVTLMVNNDKFINSTPYPRMWTLVEEYLDARQTMVDFLEQREAEGGSKSLTAKANEDVLDAWNQYTAKLVNSDTNFANFFDRWLEYDSLERITVNIGGSN